MIPLFMAGMAIILAGGFTSLLLRGRRSSIVGATSTVLGVVLACVPTLTVLISRRTVEYSVPWSVPYGSFSIGIDSLSAFFLLPVLVVSALAAVYGIGYLKHLEPHRRLGLGWLCFNALVVTMAFVLVARNGVLFLFAWELMTLSSWFLVTLDHDKPTARAAGWVYLVAGHIGVAFLLVFFAVLGSGKAGLDFNQMRATTVMAGPLFLLAIAGFGTKAGFMPLHVWLPEAHPAAPSHVSAVMSGVMIKTGIYGILRAMLLVGPPQAWWGHLLLAIGILSGLFGVIFAIAQRDLKRVLAYSSVENVGIVAIGLGLGMIGLASDRPAIAVLGFAAGLFHMLNHAIFKALLFLGAGVVQHATHTLEIDRLGGLLRRMPWTGTCFVIGAVAISGLPPLNGFASELLVYLGALDAVDSSSTAVSIAGIATIGALALIGGLATACFARAFGAVFLGEPRHEIPESGDPGWTMRFPLVALSLICAILGAAAWACTRLMSGTILSVTSLPEKSVETHLRSATSTQVAVTLAGLGLICMILLVALLRRRLLSRRSVRQAVTWDCGYAAPTSRMQYTASSFGQPLTHLFGPLLKAEQEPASPDGVLPRETRLHTHTPDRFNESMFAPLFRGVREVAARMKWIQHGHLHYYVLYIALTLLVLIVWKLGGWQ